MDDNLEGVFIVSRSFKHEIIEVAKFTHYQGCSFWECEFVGTGPADFVDCRFVGGIPKLKDILLKNPRY